jgi:DNA-binding NarL/FixJ family response regulator
MATNGGRSRALTPREVEVLQAYADTGTIPDAASRLGMSPATASAHLHSIRLKMRVSTSAQAMKLGLQTGIIT